MFSLEKFQFSSDYRKILVQRMEINIWYSFLFFSNIFDSQNNNETTNLFKSTEKRFARNKDYP